MHALLVFKNGKVQEIRIIVCLSKKSLREQVISLLEQDRSREAFEILKTKAEVTEFLSPGQKPKVRPEVTLFEDML